MRAGPYLIAVAFVIGGSRVDSAQVGAGGPNRPPTPEAAVPAILAAFDTFRVVAIGDYHGTKDLNDFVLSLIRHPAFANRVNDIVIEGTNSLFQPVLDRYTAGEDVPIDQVRRLWREPNLPTGANDFDLRLIQLVRRINQQRPPLKRLRVLAGEPPVDWPAVTTSTYVAQVLERREEHAAAVVENQVLRKDRKALIFYGGLHVQRGARDMLMSRYETHYPGVTFVVSAYVGGTDATGCGRPAVTSGISHETEVSAWPIPSLVRTKGTWLSDFSQTGLVAPLLRVPPGVETIDAYLYLGPPNLLVAETPSVFTFVDSGFRAELQRRLSIIPAGAGYRFRIDPDSVRERDVEILRCGSRW
jgi:hypothetical protein